MKLIQELIDISEADQSKLKAYKLKVPAGLTEKDAWKFVEQQDTVTIEDLKIEGGYLYLFPHFEDKFNAANQSKLQRELNSFDAQVDESVVSEAKNNLDLDELIDKYLDENKLYAMEGSRGVRNLSKLVKALDSHYRDIDTFLEDNSGAIEAIIEWIKERNTQEWAENIKADLSELVKSDS